MQCMQTIDRLKRYVCKCEAYEMKRHVSHVIATVNIKAKNLVQNKMKFKWKRKYSIALRGLVVRLTASLNSE